MPTGLFNLAEKQFRHLGSLRQREGRYRDNGELLYNLRPVETFFPEHGQVHIIIIGQCSDWLRCSHPLHQYPRSRCGTLFSTLIKRFETQPFLCINDTWDDADRNDSALLLVRQKLNELLPMPSSF